MSEKLVRICILPKEGIENPYQKLMMEGLEESGFEVIYGSSKRFFCILNTYLSKKPDWIHFDWPYSFYSINLPAPFKWAAFYWFYLQVLIISRFTKCKFGYTLHNLERHNFYNKKIDHKAQSVLFKYCNFIRVFNNETIEKISAKWDRINLAKFHVQPEGSYADYYPNEINSVIARNYFAYSPDDFVILCFGSIRPYKGIMELIDGFIENRESNWKLIIAGYPFDKNYTKQIEEKCKNISYIKLVIGHQPEEKLQYFFNACNVVACPFRQIENSGSVILAMGFKKAVIAPNQGVVKFRLKEQAQLLFDESINEVLASIKKISISELDIIGQKNYDAAGSHRWKDFSKLFIIK